MPKKARSQPRYFPVVVVSVLLLLSAIFTWQQRYAILRFMPWTDYGDITFTRYPGFGIWMPDRFDIHGIDVSRYQKRVNWSLVGRMKDRGIQLKFVFMKATEGTSLVDLQFFRNWKRAKKNGLVRGAYHYFSETSDGHSQALHFIRQVKLESGDLPPVLDVETFTGADLNAFLDQLEVWLKVVENHYGVKPILYSNAVFYNRYLHDRFSDYPLWVAHYKNRQQPMVSRAWTFWQHNDEGQVNGIDAKVDFNTFNGNDSDFVQMLVP